MKTRILFVTKTSYRGGTEKHLIDLIARLDVSRVECVVLCMGSDVYSEFVKNQQNVKVCKVLNGNSVGFLSYWALFRKYRPDTILFVNGCLGLFPWYAYLAGRLCGATRTMAIEHLIADFPERVVGPGVRNVYRRLIGSHVRARWRLKLAGLLAHKTITVSDAVRDRLTQEYGYPIANTISIRNGVDLQRYVRSNSTRSDSLKAEMGLVASDLIILCISSLDKRKRIDVLLNAFYLVSKNHPSAKCVILGSGPLGAELRKLTIELGLAGRVTFTGQVGDVRPYLEVADLFVLSSDGEGLPLSVGEAMAYGVPCVATDVGGNREIILQGQTGLLVKPGAPEQLAEAFEYLLAHPEERCRMGANALIRVRTHFDIEQAMGRLQQVLLGGL